MTTTSPRTTHPVAAIVASLVALSAWAGVAGILVGVVDFGPEVTSRLPFHSATFAAFALAAVVAAPMTWTAQLCLHNRPEWRTAGAVSGAMLFGWIIVQFALIETFSWLQPIMAAAGLTVMVAALLSGQDR